VITAWGFTGAYILAGCLALLSAVLTLFLRQPGRRGVRQSQDLSLAGQEVALS
jgi:hypothetical protein